MKELVFPTRWTYMIEVNLKKVRLWIAMKSMRLEGVATILIMCLPSRVKTHTLIHKIDDLYDVEKLLR